MPRDRLLAFWQGPGRNPRIGGAHPLPRVPAGILQAPRLGRVRRHSRHRRRALCCTGGHHQPQRVRSGQFDRGGDLGRRRRSRDPGWRRSGRRSGQPRQKLVHRRSSVSLALRLRCLVHPDHAVPATRHHWRFQLGAPVASASRAQGERIGARGHGMREDGTLLYLDGVSVSFDGFHALNELSFVLDSGEMRAVIGPNGAGKTTMMDVITGRTRPDQGMVIFSESTDLTRMDEPAIAALGIGRKFQKPTVFEPHSVRDNLILALKSDRSPWFALFARETAAERARIEEILTTIGFAALRDSPAAALSHGQKQWLEIGMLLAQDPRLLLVDEPVAGMTDAETEQTAALLREINRTRSVVVVEHDMAFVRALGVKVTVLHEGSAIAEGSIDHVSSDPRVIEVYLGR